MKNRVLYDWLTFTTKIHDLQAVIDLLGLSDNIQFKNGNGRYGYSDRLSFDGVNILYNGRQDMGICVEMSGQGCRTFETFGNGDFDGVFNEILSNTDSKQMNISRLDVAYDDFVGVLDLFYFVSAAQRGEFVSRLRDIEVIYSNKGCSVCHGNRKSSNVYVRIYDKKAERGRQDLEHWVRCEIRLKDVCALGFLKLGGDIRKNYFDVLNNYLRYVSPSDDSNKRRADTSPEWLRFIETWETVSIFDRPGTEYNIFKLDSFVRGQLSGALTTYIDVVGVEQFLKNIIDERKGKELNNKYKEIRSNTEIAADHAAAVLEYLRERGK